MSMTNAQAALLAAATRYSQGGVYPSTVTSDAAKFLEWLEAVSPDPEPVQDTEHHDLPKGYGYERS